MDLNEMSSATTGNLLTQTAALADRQVDQVLQERLGIGTAQFRILQVLQQKGSSGQCGLAEYLGQTEASISRQAKLLRSRGCVQIHVNLENKREHVLQLTSKGVQLTEAAQEILARYFTDLFSGLSAKEQSVLRSSLERVRSEVLPGSF